MTDCFALLGQPRRPWLDPDALKDRFTTLSTVIHPDKLGAATDAERQAAASRFADLNAAYQTLRDPKARLSHLIQLESGVAPGQIQEVPGDVADLFFRISSLCRDVDGFLTTRATATSPLVKAGLFARGLEWTDRLQAQQQMLSAERAALDERLRAANAAWAADGTSDAQPHGPRPLGELEAIYRRLSFLIRWNEQLQQRIVQLAE